MKPLNQTELFEHLSGFLKAKGIELKQGSYSQGIQKSCELLTDAINLGQSGLSKAKVGIDKKLDQVRQVIHEKTAPKPPVASAAANQTPKPAASASAANASPARAAAKSKGKTSKKAKSAKPRTGR